MKAAVWPLLWASGAVSLGGCATHDVALVGLYKTAQCQTGVEVKTCDEPTATVSVASNPPTSDAAASPAALFPERAEAAYINALSDPRMTKDAATLRAALATPLKAPTQTPLEQRHLTRNLTVTTSKLGAFNPDDRLELTEVFIRLDRAAGRFTTWDNAATIYNVINAGTLQIATTHGTQTNLSLGLPATAPVAASIGEAITNSSTRTDTANATFQAENLTVAVEEDGQVLRIRRQGGPGVDLTGNVAVKVGLAFAGNDKIPIYRLTELFGDKDAPTKPDKVAVTRASVDVGPQAALKATATMNYVMRHVVAGGGSLAPGSQDVREDVKAAGPLPVTLVPLEDAYPTTFGVFEMTGTEPVAIRMPGLAPERLCFASYDEAVAFQRYLALGAVRENVGDAAIGWLSIDRFTPLNAADVKQLQARSDCVKPPTKRPGMGSILTSP